MNSIMSDVSNIEKILIKKFANLMRMMYLCSIKFIKINKNQKQQRYED